MVNNTWIDYYEVLEVGPDSSADQIKRAYRKLVMLHHTDHSTTSSAESFILIKEAAETLSDFDRRVEFDNDQRK